MLRRVRDQTRAKRDEESSVTRRRRSLEDEEGGADENAGKIQDDQH